MHGTLQLLLTVLTLQPKYISLLFFLLMPIFFQNFSFLKDGAKHDIEMKPTKINFYHTCMACKYSSLQPQNNNFHLIFQIVSILVVQQQPKYKILALLFNSITKSSEDPSQTYVALNTHIIRVKTP